MYVKGRTPRARVSVEAACPHIPRRPVQNPPRCPAAQACSVPGVSSSVSWPQTSSTPQGTPGHTAQCPDPDTARSSSAQAFVPAALPRGPATPPGQPRSAQVLAAVSPSQARLSARQLRLFCAVSSSTAFRVMVLWLSCMCLSDHSASCSELMLQVVSVPWPPKTRHSPTLASHFMQGTLRLQRRSGVLRGGPACRRSAEGRGRCGPGQGPLWREPVL